MKFPLHVVLLLGVASIGATDPTGVRQDDGAEENDGPETIAKITAASISILPSR